MPPGRRIFRARLRIPGRANGPPNSRVRDSGERTQAETGRRLQAWPEDREVGRSGNRKMESTNELLALPFSRSDALPGFIHVELLKPPSMTTTSPVTNRLPDTRLIMVSATSSAVTQRLSGVALARLPIKSSYLSLSIRCIQSPSIHPGATALTGMPGPRFQASVFVRVITAALLAA